MTQGSMKNIKKEFDVGTPSMDSSELLAEIKTFKPVPHMWSPQPCLSIYSVSTLGKVISAKPLRNESEITFPFRRRGQI